MNKFVHGGRLGDAVFSLFAVKQLGGGILQQCLYHGVNWNERMLRSFLQLAKVQDYIHDVRFCKVPTKWWNSDNAKCRLIGDHNYESCTHDLIAADSICNPQDFPELVPGTWPGNVHLAKRYAHYFGAEWDPEAKWLTVPSKDLSVIDVIFHAPVRRTVRAKEEWNYILEELASKCCVLIIGGTNDIHEWDLPDILRFVPEDMLQAAQLIDASRVFLGAASSCNAIAEGLKKTRLVELANDCHNVYAAGKTGQTINHLSSQQVIDLVLSMV